MNDLVQADFETALDRLIDRWPRGTRATLVPSAGTTHVLTRDGAGVPVVLLPGGGATGASWAGVARRSAGVPLHALDIPGDAGRSVPDRPMRTPSQVHAWLDEVLDRLELGRIDLAGHSYGGWIALSYALARPRRVRRLSLIAPSMCFNSTSARYLLRATPAVLRPSARTARRLIDWETAGTPAESTTLDVYTAAAAMRWSGIVRPTRPSAADLRALQVDQVNLILAALDRSQDNAACEAGARLHLPAVEVTVLAGASHHNVLDEASDAVAELIGSRAEDGRGSGDDFLGRH